MRRKGYNKLPNKALHPTAYSPAFRSQARSTPGFRRRVSLVVRMARAAKMVFLHLHIAKSAHVDVKLHAHLH